MGWVGSLATGIGGSESARPEGNVPMRGGSKNVTVRNHRRDGCGEGGKNTRRAPYGKVNECWWCKWLLLGIPSFAKATEGNRGGDFCPLEEKGAKKGDCLKAA